MSKETAEWLNTNVLIGFTERRGHAWHYRATEQSDEPNHYPGPVPVADVQRRLFNWRPLEIVPALIDRNYRKGELFFDEGHKAIVHPTNGAVYQYATTGYQCHYYDEWLLNSLANLIDADLSIGSAGLLEQGGLAWVQVEMPDTITTPEGVKHRPWLAATSSYNSTTATTYKKGTTDIVCDNTRTAFFNGAGEQLRVKHTVNSIGKLAEARAALAIVHDVGEQFNAYVKELCEQEVANREWGKFLAEYAPDFPHSTPREKTNAESRRATLDEMYHFDPRVSPWKGTAYGVVQAVNTYVHHHQTVRGKSRAERNALMTLRGGFDRVDETSLALLKKVTA